MLFEQLRDYLEYESHDTNWISFTVKNDYMIQIKSTRDNCWYTGNYIQLIEDSYGIAVVIQLEGLPEDPYSSAVVPSVNNVEIPVRIYKLIHSDD